MKKTTAFFLVIGIINMIVGGIGAAIFYQRAESSMITHTKEDYTIKNKQALEEVHLNLTGNARYVIQTKPTNKVLMESSFGTSSTIDSSLKVEEQSNRLTISATGNQSAMTFNNLKIEFFSNEFNPEIIITIPENAEKIIVAGDGGEEVLLDGITTKNLAINLNSSDLSISNTNTEELAIQLSAGSVEMLSDNRSSEVSISADYGSVDLSDLSVEKLSISSKTADITLNRVTGSSTIETDQGEISVSNIKGDASFKIGAGSFNLNGSDLPKKLKVTANFGDISIDLDEILYDTTITATSSLGNVDIYGKEQTKFTTGKAIRSFELSTKTGDITIDGPSNHDNN